MTVTIDAIKAKQTELEAMIQTLCAQAQTVTEIEIESAVIELQAGEHYAGAVLDQDGDHQFHLVLMAQQPDKKLNWQAAKDWAASVGGSLPTRREQALLFANCKPHLKPDWHWSSQEHESDASYAWSCFFFDGYQGVSHKSYDGCAVAVRLIPITA